MAWLPWGVTYNGAEQANIPRASMRFSVFTRTLYCAPAIGGFVVVGQMLRDYGFCIQV